MRSRVLVIAVALALMLALPAAAQASWGAIAVDPTTGKTGLSTGYDSIAAAKEGSLKACGASHCKVAVWVFNGYGAVVLKSNGVYVAGFGKTRNLAFQKARERAHEQSAPRVASAFSGLS